MKNKESAAFPCSQARRGGIFLCSFAFIGLSLGTAGVVFAGEAGQAGSDDAHPCTLTVESSAFDNVFFPDEDKRLVAVIKNHTDKPRSARLAVKIVTNDGRESQTEQGVEIPASGIVREAVPLDLPVPCFAECTFALPDEAADFRTTVAVVRPPMLKTIPFEKALYGVCTMTHPATAARVGMRFIRTFVFWKWTNPSPGVFDFSSYVNFGRQCAASGVGVIYTFEPDAPAWVKSPHMVLLDQPEPLERFEAWVSAGMKAIPKGSIGAEINNEPDITMGRSGLVDEEQAARAAATLLKRGYAVVKAADPSIPVMGAGVSGNGASLTTFAGRVLRDAEGKIDYYSPHPYPGTQYITPDGNVTWPDQFLVPVLAKNVKLAETFTQGKELWSTELGWAYPANDVFLSPATRDYAAICGQALVLFKTVPHVGKLTWFRGFQWKKGLNERGYDYSLFLQAEGEGLRPTTGVNAFATVSSLLEGSRTGEALDLGPALRGYYFENPGTKKAVVAFWTTRYDVSLKDPLPEGVSLIDLYGRASSSIGNAWRLTRAPAFLVTDVGSGVLLKKFVEKARWRPEQPFVIGCVSASNTGSLLLTVESLLTDPAEVELSAAGPKVKATLRPGENKLSLSPGSGCFDGSSVRIPLKITGADAFAETRLDKLLFQVPYYAPGSLAADGVLSEEKTRLASHTLDARENISPPDPSIPWKGPSDLGVKYGYAWNECGLYMLFLVDDDRENDPPGDGKGFWNFDSLQVAFDPQTDGKMSGYQPGDREIGLFSTEGGEMKLVQSYPPKDGPPALEAKLTRRGSQKIYELVVPWPYLFAGKFQPSANSLLAVNFIVNDNDGGGRKCWIGPAEGIGSGKQPARFPWLRLMAAPVAK